MAILVDLFDSRSLTQAINTLKTPDTFILNNFFKMKDPHESDKIDIEIYKGSAEIAQFVHGEDPEPRPIAKTAQKIKTVSLPRTYESLVFTAHELSKINAIGNIYGDAATKKKAQLDYISRQMENLKNRVIRLRERMAAEALHDGKITVSQSNIDIDYDFEYTSGNKFTLSAGKLWSAESSDPVIDIRAWKRYIAKHAGVPVSAMLLGTAAAEKFLSNDKILKYLDNNNTKVGQTTMLEDITGAGTYLGKIAGVEVWEYSQQYVNAAGTEVEMIPVDRAVMVGNSNALRMHYGPSFRIQNGVSVPIMAEFLLEVDPKSNDRGIQWNLEQKALPAIHDPNSVVSVKVV